jgi:nucleoside-diphosphate-sugar epimerase
VADQQQKRVLVTGGSGFIGTHLVEALADRGDTILNLDAMAPKRGVHERYWSRCDVEDFETLHELVNGYSPTHVVHLAARSDMGGTSVADYSANTQGVSNLIEALEPLETLERAVFTSTQFVCGPGAPPQTDSDYRPHTIYGESKVLGEKIVRQSALSCTWTITRPTNIWGPYHPRYPDEFWRVLKRGLYVHPGREPVVRSYGYVRNVVHQTLSILDAESTTVDGRVFYLGDAPIDLLDWVDAFSLALTGRRARVIPRSLFRLIARAGDLGVMFGWNAPIFSSRYRSMTEDYWTPTDRTLDVFGPPPYSLADGVGETVQWLRTLDRFWD